MHISSALDHTASVIAILGFLGAFFAVGWRAFRKIDRALTYVADEMKANGGRTMRDAVNRIETGQQRHDDRLDSLEQRTATIEAHIITGPNRT